MATASAGASGSGSGGGGSSSSPNWTATELSTAQSLLGTTLTAYTFGTGLDMLKGSADNTGAAFAYGSDGIQVDTTATAGKLAQAVFGLGSQTSAAGVAEPFFLPATISGALFYVSFRVKVVTFSATAFISVGLTDGTTNLKFYYNGPVSATLWRIQGSRGGSAFETDGTGGGATVDTAAHHRMAIAGNGTTYNFYVDGVSIGSSSALSAGTANVARMQVVTQNGGTAAIRRADCDQVFATWVPPA